MNIDHAGLLSRGKIALLVEHLVVGQTLLTVLGQYLAAVQYGGHVVQAVGHLPGVADQRVGIAGHRAANRVEGLLHPDHAPAWSNIRTTYAPDWSHVFVCDDPIGLRDGTYDFEARFDEVTAMLRAQAEPLSYYSDYRGVMTARTPASSNVSTQPGKGLA